MIPFTRVFPVVFLVVALTGSNSCERDTSALGKQLSDGQSPSVPAVSAVDSVPIVSKFVQEFCDWYTPIANDSSFHHPAFFRVLNDRSRTLTPELATALRSDSAVSVNRIEHEGLNNDPFLQSQDPCERYVVDDVAQVRDAFRVRIRPVCATNIWQKSKPVLVIVSNAGMLQIANVLYDPQGDLLRALCYYARQEQLALAKSTICS